MAETVVDLMVIGAMKTGTTSLTEMLARAPSVCFSNPKEPHFFSKEPDPLSELERYHRFFDRPALLCAEGSATYTCAPEFNDRIPETFERYNPAMKILYILRDPIERI
jgi:hypothetical protein